MTETEQMRELEKFIIVNYPEFYAENLGEEWVLATIKLIEKLEKEKQEVYKKIKQLKNNKQHNLAFGERTTINIVGGFEPNEEFFDELKKRIDEELKRQQRL